MKTATTVIIGAGQAGLAMSHCLSERSIDHVVLERGDVAQSWRSQRWDSLRLLTPRWQSRLPGYHTTWLDADGYMDMAEVVDYLSGYAQVSRAPVETRTSVHAVTPAAMGYRVTTNRGDWHCRNVVLATGACAVARVPAFASALPPEIAQLTALTYRNPAQLADGGVLVVGASATGMQLAAEVRAAGHDVTLAVGEHIRTPRTYRGRDIQWWMDRTGLLDTTIDQIDDVARARRVPSLQLVGSRDIDMLDLNTLQAAGVEVTGRLAGIRDGVALFSGSLANQCALSDLKMNRLLDGIDAWAAEQGPRDSGAPYRFAPTACPSAPQLSVALHSGRFRTVIWANGLQPDFSYLPLPVFDARGRLRHEGGCVAPGLYVLGLPFLRRRKSALMDGVGDDARDLADHMAWQTGRLAA